MKRSELRNPGIGAQGSETTRLGGEGVPGAATSLDDGRGVGEKSQGQEPLAQVEPDPLDRVEFRAVGWQRHEGRLSGTVSARWSCQPAPSSTSTAWASVGSAAANCARNRSITAVLTTGSTRVKSSPVCPAH